MKHPRSRQTLKNSAQLQGEKEKARQAELVASEQIRREVGDNNQNQYR